MPGILVGIDGSDHALRALEWAMKMAVALHLPLTVLAVHQAVAGFTGRAVASPGDQELTDKVGDAARQETEKVLDSLEGAARPETVSVVSRNGLPADEILKAAEGADMVVVGSRGAGGFRHLLMGSVSSQITHHAHCPIVVIPLGVS